MGTACLLADTVADADPAIGQRDKISPQGRCGDSFVCFVVLFPECEGGRCFAQVVFSITI